MDGVLLRGSAFKSRVCGFEEGGDWERGTEQEQYDRFGLCKKSNILDNVSEMMT